MIDNALTHPQHVEARMLHYVFAQPTQRNTTSRLQHLDQDIIKNFKSQFKQRLLIHQICCVDVDSKSWMQERQGSVQKCACAGCHDLDQWIMKSNFHSNRCVVNCFRKAGLAELVCETLDDEDIATDGLGEILWRATTARVQEEDVFEARIRRWNWSRIGRQEQGNHGRMTWLSNNTVSYS